MPVLDLVSVVAVLLRKSATDVPAEISGTAAPFPLNVLALNVLAANAR